MDRGCQLLTNGIFISQRTTDISFKSCCHQNKSVDQTVFFKQLSDKNYNYENLKNTECRKCYDQEKKGVSSLRQKINYPSRKPEKIKYLQLTMSNFCNLVCKYCNSGSSTEWNKEAIHIQKLMDQNETTLDTRYDLQTVWRSKSDTFNYENQVIEFLKNLDLSDLEYVDIMGGEPMLARKLKEFLEILPASTTIQITTNGSIFPKDSTLDILNKFDRVKIDCSNESIGNLSEYIREGLNWKTFENNSKKWKQYSDKFKFRIHATHNVLSINKVHDFISWASDNNFKILNGYAFTEYLDATKVLTPDELKVYQDIVNGLPDSDTKNFILKIISHSRYDETCREQFIEFIRVVRSKHSLSEVNQQLYNFLK